MRCSHNKIQIGMVLSQVIMKKFNTKFNKSNLSMAPSTEVTAPQSLGPTQPRL